jgi:hypothetical protein
MRPTSRDLRGSLKRVTTSYNQYWAGICRQSRSYPSPKLPNIVLTPAIHQPARQQGAAKIRSNCNL